MSSNRRKKIGLKEQNVSFVEEGKKRELSLSFFLHRRLPLLLQLSFSCSVFVNSRCPSSSKLPMHYVLRKKMFYLHCTTCIAHVQSNANTS